MLDIIKLRDLSTNAAIKLFVVKIMPVLTNWKYLGKHNLLVTESERVTYLKMAPKMRTWLTFLRNETS
jgi:hypothetical protein